MVDKIRAMTHCTTRKPALPAIPHALHRLIRNQQVAGSNPVVGSTQSPEESILRGFLRLAVCSFFASFYAFLRVFWIVAGQNPGSPTFVDPRHH